jgi:hypothetical protein
MDEWDIADCTRACNLTLLIYIVNLKMLVHPRRDHWGVLRFWRSIFWLTSASGAGSFFGVFHCRVVWGGGLVRCQLAVAMIRLPRLEVLIALADATAATVKAVAVDSIGNRATAWAAWNHALSRCSEN